MIHDELDLMHVGFLERDASPSEGSRYVLYISPSLK